MNSCKKNPTADVCGLKQDRKTKNICIKCKKYFGPQMFSPSLICVERETERYSRRRVCKNPTANIFSFFSSAHQSYSRISYFLLDKNLLFILSSIEYESIVNSDHSPVVMQLCFPEHIPHTKHGDLIQASYQMRISA